MTIELQQDFDCPAADLWAVVGAPGRADWVPGVSECKFDGTVRRLTMEGAGEIAEQILGVDPETMSIQYSCIESQPPLESHLAEIQVLATGTTSCRMIWKTSVEPVIVEPFIVRQMRASLLNLSEMLA
ncbi:MAG: SRPBCC family protein [Proteobacteria bacterium]|nr:SRPBCC family protein [Pseudomonadota bacterium]